ncbi:MAG: DUF177 domain-containing protein [Nitriliruptorales bacterium]
MVVARRELDAGDGAWGPADEALVSPLDIDLTLEMLVEGLLVRGTVSFTTSLECARCVSDVRTVNTVPVNELFADPRRLSEEEELEAGYELYPEGVIDIEALLRDAVLAVLPLRVLCDSACRGLCPACGADLNVDDCGHEAVQVPDPRWAALQSLHLPPS